MPRWSGEGAGGILGAVDGGAAGQERVDRGEAPIAAQSSQERVEGDVAGAGVAALYITIRDRGRAAGGVANFRGNRGQVTPDDTVANDRVAVGYVIQTTAGARGGIGRDGNIGECRAAGHVDHSASIHGVVVVDRYVGHGRIAGIGYTCRLPWRWRCYG